MTTNNTTPNTAPNAGDNIAGAVEALMKNLRDLAAADVIGGASRPRAARRLVEASFDGIKDERDAEELFNVYAAAMAKAAGKAGVIAEQGSTPQQISKFRQFLKLGALPAVDGREVMERADRILRDLSTTDTATYPTFDALLNTARAQIKSPEETLTDEQITAAVCRPERQEKDDIRRLVDAYKAAHKLAEKIPMPSVVAAVDAYRDAIVEAGGEVPAITKEEKEQAAFMEKAAQMGFVQGPRLIAAQ